MIVLACLANQTGVDLTVGVVVIGQTISQALAGIFFPIGVYIGMVGLWIVMGPFALGLTIAYFRNLD